MYRAKAVTQHGAHVRIDAAGRQIISPGRNWAQIGHRERVQIVVGHHDLRGECRNDRGGGCEVARLEGIALQRNHPLRLHA